MIDKSEFVTNVKRMHAMGFEPMRVAPVDLESTALDRSATHASSSVLITSPPFKYVFIIIYNMNDNQAAATLKARLNNNLPFQRA